MSTTDLVPRTPNRRRRRGIPREKFRLVQHNLPALETIPLGEFWSVRKAIDRVMAEYRVIPYNEKGWYTFTVHNESNKMVASCQVNGRRILGFMWWTYSFTYFLKP